MQMNWNEISKHRNQLYGISMLWIVVFHVWESFKGKMSFNWTLSWIVRSGNLGVDLFLVLSGVSMYYAIQKNIDTTGKIRVVEFYKKRIEKIVKVYLVFCVPYFIVKYLVLNDQMDEFWKQLFFCREKGISSFWFLLCIVICYLIYPLLYKGLKKNRYLIWCVYFIWLILAFLLCKYQNDGYRRIEIMFARIPAFLLGTIFGKRIYEKESMNPYFIIGALLFLVSKGPLFFVIEKLAIGKEYISLIGRLHGNWLGFCTIIGLILVLNYLEKTKLYQFLGFLGTFTLEVYVFHVAYRNILLEEIKIKPVSYSSLFLFLIIFTVSSFVLGYLLQKILNKITFRGGVCRREK